MLYNIIIIIQVLSALAIIVLVLMQHGKGADMGAAFGRRFFRQYFRRKRFIELHVQIDGRRSHHLFRFDTGDGVSGSLSCTGTKQCDRKIAVSNDTGSTTGSTGRINCRQGCIRCCRHSWGSDRTGQSGRKRFEINMALHIFHV